MNVRVRLTPEETRAAILDAAEELFRRVGYAKTAVADIAAALGMSPANVYRFFASKSAINEAIARKMLAESHAKAREIAALDAPAGERLRTLFLGMHRYNKATYVADRRMFDMVEAAMTESWGVIEEHLLTMREIIGGIVADGIRRGEFAGTDVAVTADVLMDAMIKALHPSLIVQCITNRPNEDMEARAHAVLNLLLRGLAAEARVA